MRKTMITKTLYELFREADADKSGTISKGEFDAMLRTALLSAHAFML